MRLNRTYRAMLVLVFAGILGSFGPALSGGPAPVCEATPSITTFLSFTSQTLTIDLLRGTSGGAGALEVVLPDGSIQIPIEFDAAGEAQLVIPISDLNTGIDLVAGLRLIVVADSGLTSTSPMWALQTRNYIVDDPSNPPCFNCPVTEGGWVDYVLWPGETSGPVYPRTQVAIFSGSEREGLQPMLVLESGPAGSFPIN